MRIFGKKLNALFEKIVFSKYLSLFLLVILIFITLFIWRVSKIDDLDTLSETMHLDSQIYVNSIESRIEEINFVMEGIAEFGLPKTLEIENKWDVQTEFHTENITGVENIILVDRDLIVRRVTPKYSESYIVGDPIKDYQNKSDYVILTVPIYEYNIIIGFLMSDINLQTLFLSSEFNTNNDYMISVFKGNELLALSDNWEQPSSNISKIHKTTLNGEIYSIELSPTEELISQSTNSSKVILIFGVFISIIITGLLFILQILYKNKKVIQEKSKQLSEQNNVLEFQKIQLAKASNRLEDLVTEKTKELRETIEVLKKEKSLAKKYLKDYKQTNVIFEKSIENSPLPIMIHSEDGTVINISKIWTKLTNYTKSDIPTIYEWTKKAYGKDKEEVRKFISELYTLKKVQNDGEFIVKTKDNRELIWDFYSSSIGTLPDGKAVAMSAATDVTNRIEKEKQIEYLIYHDSLTGLHNRRYFEKTLEKLDSQEYYPLTLIMGDINGLKLVNDAFGHKEGDRLIKATAKILSDVCDEKALLSRIGGDEFIIVMSNTTPDVAELVISEIRNEARKVKINSIELSISFGLNTKTSIKQDLEEVRVSAEDRMYREKLTKIPSMRSNAIGTIINTLHEKDEYSEIHSKVVSEISAKLAIEYGLIREKVNEIQTAGLLHDIGKIIVPTSIITKKGKLTEEEYSLIKKHSEIGYRILNSSKDLRDISKIILYHHERWDGTGYPNKIKGEEIPIQSRIISIVDAFDAMTSERPYRNPISKDDALIEILDKAGTQFDPDLAELFAKKFDKIVEVEI